METRYLIPPKLNNSNLGDKIVGYRPCRHGPPRMEIEKKNYKGKIKIIGHNYGHAGSGWTLSPAIVYYLNKLLIENIEESEGDKGIKGINVPICIVGAGVIGLFTAYDLLKKGFNNLTVIAESFEELTSHIAGGLLAPFALETDNTNEKDLIDKFCIETCNFYLEIAQGKNSEFSSECVQIMPAYVDEAVAKLLEPYVTAGIMNPPKQVNVQFSNTCPNKKQKLLFVIDNAILVQTNLMMNKLYKLLKESGKINFIKKRIESFEENIEEFDVIINCTGIGAKKLCLDEKMYSMQGHLINLKGVGNSSVRIPCSLCPPFFLTIFSFFLPFLPCFSWASIKKDYEYLVFMHEKNQEKFIYIQIHSIDCTTIADTKIFKKL